MCTNGDIARLAFLLRRIAIARNHRLTLLIAGDADWTAVTAGICLSQVPSEGAWLSDRPLNFDHQRLAAGTKLLGSELDYLVYDAHSGFDPDAFGAALGALRGGGLLFLLTPPLEHWSSLVDPQAERIAVEPFDAEQVSGRFIARLCGVLTLAPGVTIIRQGDSVPHPPSEILLDTGTAILSEETACRTPDQLDAVEAIVHTARGRAHRPLIITSDRGRGKTSALGIAAARLLLGGQRRILVTAPRRAAVEPLFRHAAWILPDALVQPNRIDQQGCCLLFLPPDGLIAGQEAADLLFVDEAAGIPAPLLESLLTTFPRLVFATTVHGYEGTGRGFEVRFRRTLQRLAPNHRSIRLSTPIRWAENDPLEALVSCALLLGASPAPDVELAQVTPENCIHEALDRDDLVRDEATLSELFGLLVLAHYQTRPLDLRHLLDGPNIQAHILGYGSMVAATALVAIEGGFAPDLAREVFDGRRRPRGHLLPQTLSAHAGLEEAPLLSYARIVRIAVHPAAMGRGLGRMLLQHILDQALADGLDIAGASFGATTDLLHFWDRCGFSPVHLGTSRNAASGAHAAVVVHPLSASGYALVKRARDRLSRHFPSLLAGPFRDLEPQIAAAMIAAGSMGKNAAAPGLVDWRELVSFAFAQRPFEAAIGPIDILLRHYFALALREGRVDEREASVLIRVVLQHGDWMDTAALVGATGRAQVIQLLRKAIRRLIRLYGPRE